MSDLTSIATRLIPTLIIFSIVLLIEAIIPLRQPERRKYGRLSTNLWMMAITLGVGVILNGVLAVVALSVADRGGGLFNLLGIGGAFAFLLSILALDVAIYLAHVFMHITPALWRLHIVHHMDAMVDVTTAYRQHPIEGLYRFAVMALAVLAFGIPPEAAAIYRLLGAINSAFEHGNIRLPAWLEKTLLTVWVTPDMHKVHHSRERVQTDSNYANLFSFIDKAFGTFTPTACVPTLQYGIEGLDESRQHTLGAVLSMPFKSQSPARTATAPAS